MKKYTNNSDANDLSLILLFKKYVDIHVRTAY